MSFCPWGVADNAKTKERYSIKIAYLRQSTAFHVYGKCLGKT